MKYLLLASIAAMLSTVGSAQITDDIFSGVSYNDDVNRKVNLEAPGVIEVVSDIKFKPLKANEAYFFVIPQDLEDHLVSLTAVNSITQTEAKVEKVNKIPAELQKVVSEKNASDTVFFKIETKTSDQSGKGVNSITVREIYKRRKEPFPAKVSIREDLSLRFVDSKYYISVYPTKTQKLAIQHGAQNVLFYTPDVTADKKSKTIKYGPFKNIEALTFSEVIFHYKLSKPMPIFQEVKKTIEVSHWGNINVDEYYEMFNEAAGIKGEFGRVDYQSWDPSRATYAIKSL